MTFKNFIELFFLSGSKYCCTSVKQGNLFDQLTEAMKGIQHYITVNKITLEFIK